MTDPTDSRPTDSRTAEFGAVRVERGRATPEELAALLAVLYARAGAAAEPSPAAGVVSMARWRRPERASLFHAPRVWHPYGRAAA
ncbi:Acyl-CoA carboxylase epsilon subunit [Actinacidiphila alni]|uniref:Acyl-CoA carboxylase epsilon subunit n=1 Tax=Actinacidiphila alni TaxID=380248 RepID=A0A1I2CG84_9ACTN|nr:acyl-CoA carboxylase epsilon subunit [Actinacidiphila alni]SFE66823.1 Acyl-CoA carboxylase epsilon subunit [Actinacidiphila alni]